GQHERLSLGEVAAEVAGKDQDALVVDRPAHVDLARERDDAAMAEERTGHDADRAAEDRVAEAREADPVQLPDGRAAWVEDQRPVLDGAEELPERPAVAPLPLHERPGHVLGRDHVPGRAVRAMRGLAYEVHDPGQPRGEPALVVRLAGALLDQASHGAGIERG